MTDYPIIVIGMHRSGTTLVTRILEAFGCFMGFKQEENSESLFYQELNEWMLRQCNAYWDSPGNVRFFDNALITRLVNQRVNSIFKVRYWGFFGLFLTHRRQCWGWKDPRTMLFLKHWKTIFPKARFIHVVRDPLAVALSLQARAFKNSAPRTGIKQSIKKLFLVGRITAESLRVQHLDQGVSLWKEYLSCYEQNIDPKDSVCTIRYEDLLSSPEVVIKSMIDFLQIPATDQQIRKACSLINTNRDHIVLNQTKLSPAILHELSDPIVKRFGYTYV